MHYWIDLLYSSRIHRIGIYLYKKLRSISSSSRQKKNHLRINYLDDSFVAFVANFTNVQWLKFDRGIHRFALYTIKLWSNKAICLVHLTSARIPRGCELTILFSEYKPISVGNDWSGWRGRSAGISSSRGNIENVSRKARFLCFSVTYAIGAKRRERQNFPVNENRGSQERPGRFETKPHTLGCRSTRLATIVRP